MVRTVNSLIALVRRFGLSLRVIMVLLFLNLLVVLLEGIGVAMLLPMFELLSAGSASAADQLSGRHWDLMRSASAATGIPLTLGSLLAVSFGFILLRQAVNYVNIRYSGLIQRGLANHVRQRLFSGFLRAQSAVQEKVRVGEIAAGLTLELDRALSAIFGLVKSVVPHEYEMHHFLNLHWE